MTMCPRASYAWAHQPKDGHQTLIYRVWIGNVLYLAWLTVSLEWLRKEASLNDLKTMAIDQVLNQGATP